ncbi:hypothetical protein RND71_029698 [Anisodus tanguticus]|uniref:Uncharacterized protein n=1 Tax=Anisodus tanguticus TaxID=243964 RepID=A0AAE1REZ2_9SOLA|nr:hypothetical protein RND71_029698 [Anisodus tanguticus]
MVSLSFMLLQMVFIFLIIEYTVAHSDQAKKTFVVHEAKNGQAMALKCYLSVEKEVLDGVPAAAELTNGRVGGRKMMIERTNLKKNMKQLEADSKNSSGASADSVGNLKYHKGQGKLRVMSTKLSGKSSSSHLVKANTGSFVALNADYHMARPHPPKNN